MTKREKLNSRPLAYSKFRRSLNFGTAIDLDWMEIREGYLVAVIATTGNLNDREHIINSKPYIWRRTKIERFVMMDISKAMKVPAYYVIHDKELTLFHVHDLKEDINEFKELNRQGYTNFIKKLKGANHG